VKINQDEYDLDIFTKTPRGDTGMELESGSHSEDAAGRDFTINGMYILLSNDNGPNKDLHDFYGGMHHLQNGRVECIGDMETKMNEDPKRMMRMVRMISNYGDPKNVTDDDKKKMSKCVGGLGKISPEDIMGEFKKGMDKDDTDTRKYMTIFKDLGMLPSLFPGKDVDEDLPKELTDLGDKEAPIAWVLRGNDADSLEDLGMDKNMMKKIKFLIKSLGVNEDMDADSLSDLTNDFMGSGLSGRKLKDWGTKLGGVEEDVINAFLGHSRSPRVKVYVMDDDGNEEVSKDFIDLVDPFSGEQDKDSVNERKKELEHKNFRKHMEYMRPV
jgi:tRNA nucleotidyltransferase/poly(A) polymerase